ncbi:hypothetical protein EC973_007673 [Apophysomyces ossiformis]|uniref:Uncharacterized protein n=1 Tax=Apophysomyces ossiformis TaxID=679940 RepID=A0A8H7BVA0_9FUNG|nr:hypothetical protein EC973_007673 [Apophysomyces ossiformis]
MVGCHFVTAEDELIICFVRSLSIDSLPFLVTYFEDDVESTLAQAREELLTNFSNMTITLSGLEKHVVKHCRLSLKKLDKLPTVRKSDRSFIDVVPSPPRQLPTFCFYVNAVKAKAISLCCQLLKAHLTASDIWRHGIDPCPSAYVDVTNVTFPINTFYKMCRGLFPEACAL